MKFPRRQIHPRIPGDMRKLWLKGVEKGFSERVPRKAKKSKELN